ncbi:MAG: hypothetical protein ACPGOV_05690 [Magnetovibrionaceae bacterium]
MSADRTISNPFQGSDEDAFKATCAQMIDWVGDIEMPEERVGLREASGNIGGILVSLMMAGEACFYAEEAANVAELSLWLSEKEADADRARVLAGIAESAASARDENSDLTFRFLA